MSNLFNPEERIVAFIDILGFKNMVYKEKDKAKNIMRLLDDTVRDFIKLYKEAGKRLEAREAVERAERHRRMERDRLAAEKAARQRIELYKQLDAVRYQIKLLEQLDKFRSDDFSNEKEVKKALAIEKQYNSLWTKERQLKQKLSALE